MTTLYVVGTPIGNLEDISLRALRVLQEVALIAAEDTRKTRILLDHFQIRTPLTSYFEHNKLSKHDAILAALADKDVALVSEAGMPGLSDPGYELIREAIARDIRTVVVPGPSAVVSALVVSGLATDQFVYVGFLPRKGGERRKFLESLASERRTVVALEAPHRVLDSLRDLLAVWGERRICVARELTKLHEELFRGALSEALAHFETHAPRGEFTFVVGGASADTHRWDARAIRARLAGLAGEGMQGQEAVKQVAIESGWRKRAVYAVWLNLKQEK